MLFAFCDGLWRVVLLLGLGVAPWAAPTEVKSSASSDTATLRLLLGVLALGAAVGAIRWAARRAPLAAGLGWLTLCAAMVLSVAFSGAEGPLGRGVWVLAPLAWATLLAFAGAVALDRVTVDGARRGLLLVCLATAGLGAGGAALFASRARIASREQMWREALSADPGQHNAAVGLFKYLRGAGRTKEGLAVLLACARAEPPACPCVEEAAQYDLDRAMPSGALSLLDGSGKACGASTSLGGMHAEALAETGQGEQGAREADAVLARDPGNRFASFARAYALYLKGDKGAEQAVRLAASLGRTVGARLVLGLLRFQESDFEGAKKEFEAVLRAQPDNVAATYDMALVAHKTGRYHDAREGYLHALQLDPRHFDARYNLVILTRDAGATMEARHHLERLAHDHPGDPRARALEDRLGPGAGPGGASP